MSAKDVMLSFQCVTEITQPLPVKRGDVKKGLDQPQHFLSVLFVVKPGFAPFVLDHRLYHPLIISYITFSLQLH